MAVCRLERLNMAFHLAWASQSTSSEEECPQREHSKRPRQKLQGFLWPRALDTPGCHFHHICLVKKVSKISPDSRDGELNPTLDWGNGEDTLHKDMRDGRCCGHLWKTQLAHHLSFQICLSFYIRKWHHHSPSYLGQKLRGHAWPLPLSHLPCAIIHQVLSILTPKCLLDPINSHLDYRSHLLSGMYISSLAHPFFRYRFEISVPYLTPFSDLDSGQTPLGDLTGSPQSGCLSHHAIA